MRSYEMEEKQFQPLISAESTTLTGVESVVLVFWLVSYLAGRAFSLKVNS